MGGITTLNARLNLARNHPLRPVSTKPASLPYIDSRPNKQPAPEQALPLSGASRILSFTTDHDLHIRKMRTFFAPLLLAPLAALAAPDVFADFEPAVAPLENAVYEAMETSPADSGVELLKRQNNNACANQYFNCAGLGAPGLCCPRTAVCSADQAGQVACCPQGAACTGAIGAIATGAIPSATSTVSFVIASTTGGPFVQETNGANHGSTLPARPLIQVVKVMLQVARLL
ncbi:hypothetical protein ACET3X_009777 [Alternaria dauci]|uniref:Uncharacterized protein n=1 Tax=Alternaria dauci TaxID=48095 RepID=A0ABR3U6C5_9PLEO